MIKNTELILFILFILITQARAATELEMVNERTVDGETQTYIINALYQNEHSRYTFHDPENGATGTGVYLLSNDGGKTAHYIDTNENICHRWTNAELSENLGAFMLQSTDKFNVKTSDLEIIKLIEEPAEPIHGFPTTHFRYALRFNASYKYMLFKGEYALERQVDYWAVPELEVVVDNVPLFQNFWQHTGEDQVDQQISSFVESNTVYRLRSEILQTRTNKKGEASSTKIVQHVRALKEIADLPTDTFQVPECQDVGARKMNKKFKALLKDLLS